MNEPISARQIETAMDALDAGGLDALRSLADAFMKEQPELYRYLAEVEDELNDEERDMMMSIALVGWHIVTAALGKRPAADIDGIDERLEANYGLIDAKINEEDGPGEPLENILAQFNGQKELMTFLVTTIVKRPGEGSDGIRDEALMPMVVHLKTMVDCLS